MAGLNANIQAMLGTAVEQPSQGQQGAGQEAQSTPTLREIATNGTLLIQNVSKLSQIIEGWR